VRACLDEAYSHAVEAHDRGSEANALCELGSLLERLGDGEQARQMAERALAIARETNDRNMEAEILVVLGNALAAFNHPDAGPTYERGLALARESNRNGLVCMALAGLARVALRRGELGRALDRVEQVLPWLDRDRFGLGYDPFWVRWTCYRVLAAWQDPRAGEVLAAAQAELRVRAELIEDEALRESFLENVVVHAEIARARASSESSSALLRPV